MCSDNSGFRMYRKRIVGTNISDYRIFGETITTLPDPTEIPSGRCG